MWALGWMPSGAALRESDEKSEADFGVGQIRI